MPISMPIYQPGTGNLVRMTKGGFINQRKRMRDQSNRMAINRARRGGR